MLAGVILVVIIFAGAVVLLNFDRGEIPSAPSSQDGKERVPQFALQDYSGKTVTLGDFQGKPIVVNSWAAWCPFCRKELVDFATVQKELGDQVVIIAIDRGEPLATAKRYTDELGVTDTFIFLLDPDDTFYRNIGGFSMPETIFVDREGIVRVHKRGPMEPEEIRQNIKTIL